MELAKKKPINGCGGVGARSWVHSGFGDTGVEGMFDVPGPPRRGGPGTALPK